MLIVLSLISLITLTVGYIALNSNQQSKTNIWFFEFCFFSVLWTITNFFSVNVQSELATLFWIKAVLSVSTLLLFSLINFVYVYPSVDRAMPRKIFIPLLLFTIFVSIISFFPVSVEGVSLSYGKISPKFGLAYGFYALYLLGSVLTAFGLLYRKYKTACGIDKLRIQYLIFGLFLTIALAVISNFLLVLLGISFFVQFGPISLLVFDAFVLISIFKYKFLNIRFLIGQMLYYALAALFCYMIFYVIAFLETKYFENGVFSTNAFVIGGVNAVIFVYLFDRYNRIVLEKVNTWIVYPTYNPDQILDTFSQYLSKELELEKVSSQLLITLQSTLNPKFASIVVLNKDSTNEKVLVNKTLDPEFGWKSWNKLLEDWKGYEEDVVTYDELLATVNIHNLSNDIKTRLEKLMKTSDVSVVMKFTSEHNQGLLIIGSLDSGKPYTIQELNFIRSLLNVYNASIDRAQLYLQAKNFNQILEKRVEEATEEIRNQNQTLQERFQQEKDMTGIMGHELRTPLTIAKGNLELLLSKVRKIPEAELTDIVETKSLAALDSLQRGVEILETMLSASHVDNDQFDLNITEVNVDEVIKYFHSHFEKSAKAKGLTFEYIQPDFEVPLIMSDQRRVEEVISNIISNAVKYTNNGGIKVYLEIKDSELLTHVEDTGIGIPAEEIEKLGRKFYRVHQHLDAYRDIVRAGGTGLGLYVVKGILKALKGELRVQSVEGKGSTFTIALPLENKFTQTLKKKGKPDENVDMFVKLGLKH